MASSPYESHSSRIEKLSLDCNCVRPKTPSLQLTEARGHGHDPYIGLPAHGRGQGTEVRSGSVLARGGRRNLSETARGESPAQNLAPAARPGILPLPGRRPPPFSPPPQPI